MNIKLKTLTPLAATLLISACATTSPTFIIDQKTSAARDLGIAATDITILSRCQFAEAPFGKTVADYRVGVCALTKDSVVVRAIDPTSTETRAFKTIVTKEIESISLHSGISVDQVQVRTKDNILIMIMRPDGGIGFNNGTAKDYFAQLKQTGVREVESRSAIGPAQSGGAVFVPIIIPAKR
jgi:hypothetical protein